MKVISLWPRTRRSPAYHYFWKMHVPRAPTEPEEFAVNLHYYYMHRTYLYTKSIHLHHTSQCKHKSIKRHKSICITLSNIHSCSVHIEHWVYDPEIHSFMLCTHVTSNIKHIRHHSNKSFDECEMKVTPQYSAFCNLKPITSVAIQRGQCIGYAGVNEHFCLRVSGDERI